jgi:hypothetical protein
VAWLYTQIHHYRGKLKEGLLILTSLATVLLLYSLSITAQQTAPNLATRNRNILEAFCGSGLCSWLSWVPLAQGVSGGLQPSVNQKWDLTRWLDWRRNNLYLHPCDWQYSIPPGLWECGPQFLTGFWLETFLRFLLLWPLHKAAYTQQQLASLKVSKQEDRGTQDRKQSFCNLISKATTHHHCHILFTRKTSLNPVHSQGEETIQGNGHQEAEITRTLHWQ